MEFENLFLRYDSFVFNLTEIICNCPQKINSLKVIKRLLKDFWYQMPLKLSLDVPISSHYEIHYSFNFPLL